MILTLEVSARCDLSALEPFLMPDTLSPRDLVREALDRFVANFLVLTVPRN